MTDNKKRLAWLPPEGLIGLLIVLTISGFFMPHYLVNVFGGTVRYTFFHDYLDQPFLGLALFVWLILGQVGAFVTLRLKQAYVPAVKQMVVGIAALLVLIVMAQWAYMLISDVYAIWRVDPDVSDLQERFGLMMYFLGIASPFTLVLALLKPAKNPF